MSERFFFKVLCGIFITSGFLGIHIYNDHLHYTNEINNIFEIKTNLRISKTISKTGTTEMLNVTSRHVKYFAKRNNIELRFHLSQINNGIKPSMIEIFNKCRITGTQLQTSKMYTQVINGYQKDYLKS